MNDPLLETRNLTKQFSGLVAVNEISVSFEEGKLHAIIGPNGAGKTTFFNLLTGTLPPSDGTILFKSEDITSQPAEKIVHHGIVRSYQITQLFEGLSVLENVRIAVQTNYNSYNFWKKAENTPEMVEKADAILEQVGLANKRDVKAETLSHGEQRTLEIAVALGTDPDLLLLDEPSSGMSPEETNDVIDLINELADDITIIFIEHKMSVVMGVADRIVVLHDGRVLADGKPATVRQDEEVQQVYLGGE